MRSWPVVVALLLLLAGTTAYLVSSSGEPTSRPAQGRGGRRHRASRPQLPTLPRQATAHPLPAGNRAGHAGPQHPHAAALPADPRAALRWFEDARVPLRRRAAAIDALARAGDAEALRLLLDLADAGVYLSWRAVEALGALRDPAPPAGYLRRKLGAADPRVAAAAVRALERRGGPGDVAALAAALRHNSRRADGLGETINAEAVRALGASGSAAAAPALIAELARVQREGTNLEYGSQLVAALGQIATPSARRAVDAYGAWLASALPDDPLARRYHLDKIAEARRAAGEASGP
jgi:hypothetical protein